MAKFVAVFGTKQKHFFFIKTYFVVYEKLRSRLRVVYVRKKLELKTDKHVVVKINQNRLKTKE